MRIVFPDGAGCVQHPSDLDPLRALGPVDFYDGPPPDRPTLLERLRPAEAVVLDYSEMDGEVLRACEHLRFISFLGIGYASCIDVAEATRRKIAVAYTPDYGATSFAARINSRAIARRSGSVPSSTALATYASGVDTIGSSMPIILYCAYVIRPRKNADGSVTTGTPSASAS